MSGRPPRSAMMGWHWRLPATWGRWRRWPSNCATWRSCSTPALQYVRDPRLLRLIEDVRCICAATTDWHSVRAIIDDRYGYAKYPGPCHIVPNHAMVLASLLLGGDNFQRAVIDRRVGRLRHGLQRRQCRLPKRHPAWAGGLDGRRRLSHAGRRPDVRGDCRRRLLCHPTRCSRRGVSWPAAAAYRGEPIDLCRARFGFDFRGSTAGLCPTAIWPAGKHAWRSATATKRARPTVCRSSTEAWHLASAAAFRRRSFWTLPNWPRISPRSPAQRSIRRRPSLRICVLSATTTRPCAFLCTTMMPMTRSLRCEGEAIQLRRGDNEVRWTLPPLDGMPIFRLGIGVLRPRPPAVRAATTARIVLLDLDWTGAPQAFVQTGMMMTSIWNLAPRWLQAWVSSARHFAPDFKYTYCISHPEQGGVVTIGTRGLARLCRPSAAGFLAPPGRGPGLAQPGPPPLLLGAVLRAAAKSASCAVSTAEQQVLASDAFCLPGGSAVRRELLGLRRGTGGRRRWYTPARRDGCRY